MNQLISKLNDESKNREINFSVGDTIKVHYKISVDPKTNAVKTQAFEGAVIGISNKDASKTFTVRRVSYDVGVERIFPLYSPKIAKIELIRKGDVGRSKLYFLRERSGKSAKIKEKKGGHAEVASQRKKMLADEKKANQKTEPESQD